MVKKRSTFTSFTSLFDTATLLGILVVLCVFLVLWNFRWSILESMTDFYDAREIEPGLWIGSSKDSKDREFMEAHDVRLVVNCTYNLPRKFLHLDFVRVPVHDNRDDDRLMLEHLPEAVEAIRDHRARGNAVLVHCFAGVSRSATVCAAYLVRDRGMSVEEAIAAIQAKKPETFGSRPVFEKALRDYRRSVVVAAED